MAEDIEIWEITIPGTVWVWQKDPREPTGYRQVKVGGASKKLRISTEDREFNEEQIPEENVHLNPFRNGSLVRRVSEGEYDGLTDDRLRQLLALDEPEFRDTVTKIDSELTARRLDKLARDDGKVWQYEITHNHVIDNWRRGGTQRTVQEMMDDTTSRGTVLSG